MRWLFLSQKTTCKVSAFSGTRRCNKKVIYKHQEMTQSQETHDIKAFWLSGCPQQGTINADAAIRILNRSDNRNSVCVDSYTRFILHYRFWWVWGPHSLWGTQSLFDVCCALIDYLFGMESHLTRLFLHSSSQRNTCWWACVFKIKLHIHVK